MNMHLPLLMRTASALSENWEVPNVSTNVFMVDDSGVSCNVIDRRSKIK